VLLNERENVTVVVNDFGTLKILRDYPDLHPHLGRQLLRVPARTPWVETIMKDGDRFERKQLRSVFSSTSLDYPLTMEFFQRSGVKSVDVDWLYHFRSQFNSILELGFALAIHLNLVPVTVTRKCHEARFVGEIDPERCSMPCLKKAFLLKNEMFNVEMFLLGNVVFRIVETPKEQIKKLGESPMVDFVIDMNPLTGLDSRQKVDDFMRSLTS